ncbi:MAG: TRAP transporter small permease [Bacillota bacterium]
MKKNVNSEDYNKNKPSMLNLLKRVFKFLDSKIEEYAITVFYFSFTVILLNEVIRRYFFAASTDWSEEVARFLFVFLVCFAAAYAVRERGHLRISIIDNLVSKKIKFYLYIFYDICFLILAVAIIYYSVQIMQLQIRTDTLAMSESLRKLNLNMAYVYAAVPLGWALMIYRLIQRFILTIKEYKEGKLE